MDKTINLDLDGNAIDSLEQGLENYKKAISGNPKYYKHAILNIAQYIELSLKFFVSKIHPKLIYQEIFLDKKKLEKTITTQQAVNFLKHLEEYTHLESEKNLEWLKKTSNEIKHHKLNIEPEEIKNKMGKILSCIDKLHKGNDMIVSQKLKNISENSLVELYQSLLDGYLTSLRLATNEAKKLSKEFIQTSKDDDPVADLEEAWLDCPSCDEHTFILDAKAIKYSCTYCGHEDTATECQLCNKMLPMRESYRQIEELFWCSRNCLDQSQFR